MSHFTRRAFALSCLGTATAGLAGCMGSSRDTSVFGDLFGWRAGSSLGKPDYAAIYGTFPGEPYPIKPFRYSRIDPAYLRQEVAYTGDEVPGTIVVDPSARFLYHVADGGRATRYGVGVGREGFGWSGRAQINMKRDWPSWVPPREMVARDPEIRAQLTATGRGLGVPGGDKSPLGARAMYLFNESGDTGYRLHGTLEPETIGTQVSSGCIRMVNQDIIHLYAHTPVGTRVVVLA